jgi:hypothetical protein
VSADDQTGLGAGGDASAEGLQAEGGDVHPAAYGWVRGVEQLESAIDEEAVDAVGADPAADDIGGLQHRDVTTRLGQRLGAAQPGQPCSHDHHVCVHGWSLESDA